MENIIKKIIELEHNAQDLVEEGSAEAERIRQSGVEECRTMEIHIMEMAESKIKKLEKKSEKDTEDRVIRIYEDTALKMRLMEENAEQNGKKWEDEIFYRITRGE